MAGLLISAGNRGSAAITDGTENTDVTGTGSTTVLLAYHSFGIETNEIGIGINVYCRNDQTLKVICSAGIGIDVSKGTNGINESIQILMVSKVLQTHSYPFFLYSTGTGAGTDQDHADFSTVEFWQVKKYTRD